MDEAVRQDFDSPIFYKRDLILTQLVVDRLFTDMLGAGQDRKYNIFYAGTSMYTQHNTKRSYKSQYDSKLKVKARFDM